MILDPFEFLNSPKTIRERCNQLYLLGLEDRLDHFRIREDRLPISVELVKDEILANYPDLNVPPHSRWQHFDVRGTNHWSPFKSKIRGDRELLLAQIDLAVTSVLLDAGAGPDWRFQDPLTGENHSRSEGLALASLYLFSKGTFSSDPNDPLKADAESLRKFGVEQLAEGFQVSAANPLVGLEERAALLRRLGEQLLGFLGTDQEPNPRIANILDKISIGEDRVLKVDRLLGTLLKLLQDVWPPRLTLGGRNLGDVWRHHLLVHSEITSELVPFHKLSQWLTYSLLEPLEEAGFQVQDIELLTGLPEYRNGGLFFDTGVLELKKPDEIAALHPVSSELIVEWRALTVILLDRLGEQLREKMGLASEELPLPQILQGGTWSTGRKLAYKRRPDG
ncbi:MAG: DUF1688 family protein, partial [Deltaproteobacteria bacterium]